MVALLNQIRLTNGKISYMNADVLSIKRAIEEDFSISLKYFKPTKSGQESDSFFATLNNQKVVIKYTKSHNSYPKEIFLYENFKDLSLDVPEVIFYKEKPKNIGYPCMIMTRIPEKSLDELFLKDEIPNNLIIEMGQLLKKLHRIKTKGFGFLDGNLSQLKGNYDSLKQFYETELKLPEKFAYLKEQSRLNANEYNTLLEAFSSALEISGNNTFFVLNDYQPANIFSNGKKITGIIDPGNAFSCNIEHDLGITMIFLNPGKWDLFLEGYGYKNIKNAMYFGAILCAFKTSNNFRSKKLDLAEKRLDKLKILINKIRNED